MTKEGNPAILNIWTNPREHYNGYKPDIEAKTMISSLCKNLKMPH